MFSKSILKFSWLFFKVSCSCVLILISHLAFSVAPVSGQKYKFLVLVFSFSRPKKILIECWQSRANQIKIPSLAKVTIVLISHETRNICILIFLSELQTFWMSLKLSDGESVGHLEVRYQRKTVRLNTKEIYFPKVINLAVILLILARD